MSDWKNMLEASSSAPNPRLSLRPAEAAKALGVSQRHLWELTHREKHDPVPHVRLGRATVYPIAALRAWLERRTVRKESQDGEHCA